MTRSAGPSIALSGVAELAADLDAWDRPGIGRRDTGWLARPALLRRAGRLLGERIPPAVDGILGYGEDALPLVTAVSLYTGLPFLHAAVASVRAGSVRPGEQVAVVAITADEAQLGATWALANRLQVAAALSVFGAPDSAVDSLIAELDGGTRDGELVSDVTTTEQSLTTPELLDRAARSLSRSLPARPALVVSYADGESQVLAHAVARELGVTRVVLDLDLGRMQLRPEPPTAGRAVLVAGALDSDFVRHVPATVTLMNANGLDVIAVAVLSADGEPVEVPVTVVTPSGRAG